GAVARMRRATGPRVVRDLKGHRAGPPHARRHLDATVGRGANSRAWTRGRPHITQVRVRRAHARRNAVSVGGADSRGVVAADSRPAVGIRGSDTRIVRTVDRAGDVTGGRAIRVAGRIVGSGLALFSTVGLAGLSVLHYPVSAERALATVTGRPRRTDSPARGIIPWIAGLAAWQLTRLAILHNPI